LECLHTYTLVQVVARVLLAVELRAVDAVQAVSVRRESVQKDVAQDAVHQSVDVIVVSVARLASVRRESVRRGVSKVVVLPSVAVVDASVALIVSVRLASVARDVLRTAVLSKEESKELRLHKDCLKTSDQKGRMCTVN